MTWNSSEMLLMLVVGLIYDYLYHRIKEGHNVQSIHP